MFTNVILKSPALFFSSKAKVLYAVSKTGKLDIKSKRKEKYVITVMTINLLAIPINVNASN